MSKKPDLKEDIELIERLIQDQLNLIESRLRELQQIGDVEQALKKALEALRELHESCTLTKALVANLKNNSNHSAKAEANSRQA